MSLNNTEISKYLDLDLDLDLDFIFIQISFLIFLFMTITREHLKSHVYIKTQIK